MIIHAKHVMLVMDYGQALGLEILDAIIVMDVVVVIIVERIDLAHASYALLIIINQEDLVYHAPRICVKSVIIILILVMYVIVATCVILQVYAFLALIQYAYNVIHHQTYAQNAILDMDINCQEFVLLVLQQTVLVACMILILVYIVKINMALMEIEHAFYVIYLIAIIVIKII
jgi:hypothetical protein